MSEKQCSKFMVSYAQYICSALFGNLRNFEIALRILSIAKLRANFEIAYAISTRQLRNLEMEMSEQDTPALDSSDHTFLQ